ncbi:MAG: hypothetical protein PWP27_501 [Clostridiales bacterium]|jgi:hypothetical protein|nr:hypothetical protein [Clostridiales bacterium]MDK2932691.1 hypothetical protein [Clostridiales bacterium]
MNYIQNPVQVITRKMVTPNQYINIDYPVIIRLANSTVQQTINNVILHTINMLIKKQMNKLIVEQGYKNPVVSMDGWYEIKTNERGIFSLTIGNYTFAYPAAHGLTILKSLTFDIQSGKIYKLSEMFKPESNYVKVLSDIIEKQIQARDIPLLGEFKGIAPEQYYYIADKCLVIYFQLYDITPYAFGFPFFPISVYEIQDIVKENSPLGKMATND